MVYRQCMYILTVVDNFFYQFELVVIKEGD